MVCLNKPTLLTALDIWSKIYLKCAESDGRIDSSEKVLIGMNKVLRVVMFIIELAMNLWGTVVVFGAWATWTYDLEKYKANMDELNYCKNLPMTFAFADLIISWVSSKEQKKGILERDFRSASHWSHAVVALR